MRLSTLLCSRQELRGKLLILLTAVILSGAVLSIMIVVIAISYNFVLEFVVRDDYPRLIGPNSLLNLQPALSVVPMPDSYTSLIRFRFGHRYTYASHVNSLIAFTQHYEQHSQINHLENCLINRGFSYQSRKSCDFNIDYFIECNINNEFGYGEAQPCFVIKLNKIYGWIPHIEPATDSDIKIKCSGLTPSDTENMGPICYYDYTTRKSACNKQFGKINSAYFPFMKQETYRSPFVMIKLMALKRNIAIMMKCFIINLRDVNDLHSNNTNLLNSQSDVHFEVLMD